MIGGLLKIFFLAEADFLQDSSLPSMSFFFYFSCRLWLETAPLTDSSLRDTVPGLTGLQLDANASIHSLENTGLAYCGGVSGLYRRLVFLLFEKPFHAPLYLYKLA